MKQRFDPGQMTFVNVTAPKTSHIIPWQGDGKLEMEVRSEGEVCLNFVTLDGETVPQEKGSIVRWNGLVEGCSGVEIVSDTSFWYRCRKSTKWWEIPDPTPVVIELVQTPADVIRTLIDERLRVWKHQQNINRDLSDDEKDELILDIVNGDLEFDETPDEFGLGYEERLEEFKQRQESAETPPDPEPATPVEPDSEAAKAAS